MNSFDTNNLFFLFTDRPDPIPIDQNANDESRKIVSPSTGDHNMTINTLKVQFDNVFRLLRRPNPSMFKVSSQDLTAISAKIVKALEFDRDLGRIFHTSGLFSSYHTDDNISARLDYGTVMLTKRRSSSGGFPMAEPSFNVLCGAPHNDNLVYASGCTQGHRLGQLHDPTVVVRIYDQDRLVSETIERAILPWDPPNRFADRGDSGALVYTPHRCVGIIWGGIERQRQRQRQSQGQSQISTSAGLGLPVPPQDLTGRLNLDITFFTPIETIISAFKKDLNKVLGEGNYTLRWAGDDASL